MKVTVKQLKQLIREQVEEMAGMARSKKVEKLLATVKALSPDEFRAFRNAIENEDLEPSDTLSQALAEKDWHEINLQLGDEIYRKAEKQLGNRMASKLSEKIVDLANGEVESRDPRHRLQPGDTDFVIKAMRKLGYEI